MTVGYPLIGRAGPSEGVSSCGDRATALRKYICKSSHRPKLCTTLHTKAVRDVAAVDAQALIFVAAVVVMVALLVLA